MMTRLCLQRKKRQREQKTGDLDPNLPDDAGRVGPKEKDAVPGCPRGDSLTQDRCNSDGAIA